MCGSVFLYKNTWKELHEEQKKWNRDFKESGMLWVTKISTERSGMLKKQNNTWGFKWKNKQTVDSRICMHLHKSRHVHMHPFFILFIQPCINVSLFAKHEKSWNCLHQHGTAQISIFGHSEPHVTKKVATRKNSFFTDLWIWKAHRWSTKKIGLFDVSVTLFYSYKKMKSADGKNPIDVISFSKSMTLYMFKGKKKSLYLKN